MTRAALVSIIAAFGTLTAAPEAAAAQQLRPLPDPWVAAAIVTRPTGLTGATVVRPAPSPAANPHARVNRVLIGGVLGAVAGVITCQLISSAVNALQGDPNTGCTSRGNIQFAVGGAVGGGFIGWATYHKPSTGGP